jgi:allantoinase
VHVNEPGRADWEGFDTATRAAAAGGVTTIVDMPLNSIPATTTVAALGAKMEAARGRCHVDVGFWGGVVPGNSGELDGLIDAGTRGFKCFLVPSGVDEFPPVDEAELRRALPVLARRRVPLLVHAESPALIGSPEGFTASSYAAYLATRPPAAEVEAIGLMIRLAGEFRASTHIVHVSSAGGVDLLARAKAAGVPITAETCPHYLSVSAGDISDGATEFKCAPPIREAAHRDALWRGLDAGTIDMIATDHSPAPPSLKTPGNFVTAWGGIASLELGLRAVWTAGSRGRSTLKSQLSGQLSVERSQLRVDVARWMSEWPATLAGLSSRKGRIAPGLDADLVVWDPDEVSIVDASHLQMRHKVTPFAGRTLFGKIVTTFLRGERVWDDGRLARAYGGGLL